MPRPFKKQIHKTCKAMGGGRFPGITVPDAHSKLYTYQPLEFRWFEPHLAAPATGAPNTARLLLRRALLTQPR